MKEILKFIKQKKQSDKSLKDVYEKITFADFSLNKECLDEFNSLFQQNIEQIINSIKQTRFKDKIYEQLQELWLFYQDHDKIDEDIIKIALYSKSKDQYEKLKGVLNTIKKSIINRIKAIFQNKENSNVFLIKIDDQECLFEIKDLTWFTLLSKKYPDLKQQFAQNLDEQILDLFDFSMKYIEKYQSEFSSRIKSNNPAILSEVFSIIVYMRNISCAQETLSSLFGDNFEDSQQIYQQLNHYLNEFVNLTGVANKKQFCTKLAESFIAIKGYLMKSNFLNSETESNDSKRKEYYNLVEKQFNFIQQSQQIKQDLLEEVNIDADQVLKDCEDKIKANYKEIEEQAIKLTNQLLSLKTIAFKNLNNKLENLKIIEQIFKDQVPSNFVQIKKNAVNMICQQAEKIKSGIQSEKSSSKDITEQLIISQDIATNVTELIESAQGSISDILDTFQKNSKDQSQISELALLLKRSPIGSQIIEKQPIFICEQRTFWAKKIEHQDIGYVLDNLMKGDGKTKISAKEKQSLKLEYDRFQEEYKNLVENNIAPFDSIPKNRELLKVNLLQLSENSRKFPIDQNEKNKIHQIIANLFAIWTISDFKNNKLKSSDMQGASSILYLLRPHPSQVISIFRILGIGYEKVEQQDQNKLDVQKKVQIANYLSKTDTMFDNLVQIKTGEGKSITLGIVISVFALWDFDVSCACYSQYLSERDRKSFDDLFTFLNIQEKIFYGTFNKICERYINKDGDLRNLVLNSILKDSNLLVKTQPPVKKRVTLIDEVDVFFSKEFLSKAYVPVAKIKHEKVTKLLDFIWKNRAEKLSSKILKGSKEYAECSTIFKPEFVGILDEACKNMIHSVKNFLNHGYKVKNKMIGYQEMDQLNFNRSFGYDTIFAYYHHLDTPQDSETVSQQNLDNCKAIEIRCGKFSYAEIPLYSMLLLGVTGTLDSLTHGENQIIQDVFQIKNFTYSPSVYGSNKLLWEQEDPNKRLLIFNELEYYNELTNVIKNKMGGGNNTQRAVLVFFKTSKILDKYIGSDQYKNLKCDKQELTEVNNDQEKESRIVQATYQNTLTVTTRSFGRGTDFICRDDVVEKNGGVHVILTFVPDLHSEFIQIQGRTGRQGNNGSFQMILLDSDLQTYGVDASSQEFKQQYDKKLEYIFDKRNNKTLLEQVGARDGLAVIREFHLEALEFKDNLLKNDIIKSQKYLMKINAGAQLEEDEIPVKTLILMDATGSMSSLLQKAKDSVNQMFERAGNILKQNKLKSHLNWIQYACYRNYSSRNLILQNSGWESQAEKLKEFMDQIDVSGGMGNEAVEIGFQHAVKQAKDCDDYPLTQVYLIGDMPPNTKEEVQSRRNAYEFEKSTQFQSPAYWETELEKLKELNVQVNTFYLDNEPKEVFEEIARRTGGASFHLDVTRPNSQDILLNLFVPNILKLIGEANGDADLGEKLVADYMNCYSSE